MLELIAGTTYLSVKGLTPGQRRTADWLEEKKMIRVAGSLEKDFSMEREEKVRRIFHAAGEILSDPDRHGIGFPNYNLPNPRHCLCLVLTVADCCLKENLTYVSDLVVNDLCAFIPDPIQAWEGPGTTTESRLEIARKLREY